MKKIALVDVDSTLWDFTGELRRRMEIELKKKIPKEFDSWEHPISFFEKPGNAYHMFNEIHEEQHTFKPFRFAEYVLKDLVKLGYYILIASNRIPRTEPQLRTWLACNNLPYDEIYCDLDKRTLFYSRDIDLVIDDSPQVLEEALKYDIKTLALTYKYNKQIRGIKKFNDLKEMHTYLVQEMIS